MTPAVLIEASHRAAFSWLRRLALLALMAVAWLAAAPGCSRKPPSPVVIVYVSVDQAHAEPVLARFTEQTGIEVRPVFDVEAAKAAGLARRIVAEKSHPQADVFWNGELSQTLMLARAGALQPYRSPSAAGLPGDFVDPQGLWAGCAGRARVLLVAADVPDAEMPSSLYDLARPGAGLAHPLFGTSATHAAALFAMLGPDKANAFYQSVRSSGVRIADGNSVVRDLVASGDLKVGLVDTDDACEAMRRGARVRVIAPDQGADQMGALVIPTTVAMVAGAPHPDQAKALVDFLLSEQTERMLVASGWSHAPARQLDTAPPCFSFPSLRRMRVDPERMAGMVDRAREDLRALFAK